MLARLQHPLSAHPPQQHSAHSITHTAADRLTKTKHHTHSSPLYSLAGQCAVQVVWQVVAVQQATGQEQGTVRAYFEVGQQQGDRQQQQVSRVMPVS